jgi:hypothetical protein
MHAWKKIYQMREAVKSRLMEKMYKKLREGKQKLTRDNEQNLTYLSGMMMETDAEQETCSRKTRSITGKKRCPHCNQDSHQQRTSRLCPKNKKILTEHQRLWWILKKRAKVSTLFETHYVWKKVLLVLTLP